MTSMQDAPAHVASPSPTVALSRQVILDATARALAEVGYDGTTIRKIASLLNCAVGSIYRYFNDKRELLLAVAERRLEGAAAVMESGGSFDQSVQLYIDAAIEEPQTYRLMFWLSSVGPTASSQAELPAIVSSLIAGWGRRLGDAALAQRAWAVLHGSLMLGLPREQVLAAARQTLNAPLRPAAPAPVTPQPTITRPTSATIPTGVTAANMLQSPVRMDLTAPVNDETEAEPAAAIANAGKSDDVCLL